MKISVLGAGAMGCLFAGYLSKKNDVTLIDSYLPQVDAINKNGVKLIETDGSESVHKIKAVVSGEKNEKAELLIVFVKNTVTYEALKENIGLIDSETVVLTLQNGMGNDEEIKKLVDNSKILIGTTKHNSVNLGGGAVRHGGAGKTAIGGENKSKLKEVVDNFNECGIETEASDSVKKLIWDKLFVNLSVNSCTALMDSHIGFITENKDMWEFAQGLIQEAVKVAKADCCEFDEEKVVSAVKHVCESDGAGIASMCQDRHRKIKTEIDHINGAVVELGKKYGVETPLNYAMVKLIHAMEGTY